MILQEKIHRMGADRSHHKLFDQLVRVDEKIDGSQITFGMFDGRLMIRSKGRDMSQDEPTGMFGAGIDAVGSVAHRLRPGWTYHGEYLQKPKHNVLAYDRVPHNHVVLFDATDGGQFVDPGLLAKLCAELGAFEPVQWRMMAMGDVAAGVFPTSTLGGIPEGVVVKHGSSVATRVVAKLVSEQFREVKSDNTTRTRPNTDRDIATTLANKYCPAARFAKAVQRLKESGTYTGTRADIGPLRKAVSMDIEGECREEIQEQLYGMFRKDLLNAALAPLAAWYEQWLTNDNAYWSTRRVDAE